MRTISALILLAVTGWLVTAPLSTVAAHKQTEQLPWGQVSDGIQLSLTAPDRDGLRLQLAFRNAGDRDVTLDLGSMLANGKVQLPNYIVLDFTDARGKQRLFKFADKKHSFVAGRLDDYIVPLRAGSVYTLTLSLDQFWCQETREFEIPLQAGENHLTAHFEGSGAKNVSPDLPAIKLMNFWLGKVESNTLVIARSE